MGKRSNFDRIPKDKYRTFDPRAGAALAPHLYGTERYWEPCAAGLDLVRQLDALGLECAVATDIQPEDETVFRSDALKASEADFRSTGANSIITNPPWRRDLLHQMIVSFSDMAPTWLLFDADWIHTRQSAPFTARLRKVVSVGRLIWIEGTTTSGKDNCAWHLFDKPSNAPTEFYGRVEA